MGEGDAEVEAPAFMPGEDVHPPYSNWSEVAHATPYSEILILS